FRTYFVVTDAATSGLYALSLHDALPIWPVRRDPRPRAPRTITDERPSEGRSHDRSTRPDQAVRAQDGGGRRVVHRASRDRHRVRSEEHTSELQSRENLVCRLLLEKKKHI